MKPILFGKNNTLKVDILPKLLYFFQRVPKSFFHAMHTLSIQFIWNHGLSSLHYKLLTHAKLQGGVGLHNFELYHIAALLSRMLEWFLCPLSKASTIMEQELSLSQMTCELCRGV